MDGENSLLFSCKCQKALAYFGHLNILTSSMQGLHSGSRLALRFMA